MSVALTQQGKVQGIEKLGCLQFRGIPFAAPPIGTLRWKAPQPHPTWDDVRDATQWGPTCPQTVGTMERMGGADVRSLPPMDEAACLTLNVFTPALDDEPRPVMVWIHGGAFTTGSNRIPWYSGHNFTRDGVVVVTINYRLNAFGFLHLEELFGDDFSGSGTSGIRDQIAALTWVRDNIANFGGDPTNVTIFGESAGGMSVGTLLASPKASGLFHKAIPQSGAAHTNLRSTVAAKVAGAFCEHAGVTPGDTDALLALTQEQVVTAVEQLQASITAGLQLGDDEGLRLAFQPVVGDDALPTRAIDAVREGSANGVPTLVGTTLEEFKLFSLGMKPESAERAVQPGEIADAYGAKVGGEALDVLNAIETDRVFRIPAIRLAEAQVASGAPTWMYRFDWKSSAFGGRLGACHALEIPFAFDNLDAPGVNVFTGGTAPQSVATQMHAAWVAFAKTGDPNTSELPAWPTYDRGDRATMLFDETSSLCSDPDGDLRELWSDTL
ncbi:MAG: carboxylesterase/lipase family protein [Actinomycetota bacterium]